MRVFLVSTPPLGHLFPMIPLAWALRSAGHDVLVATTGPALAAATVAGLPAVDIAPGLDMGLVFTRVIEEHPHLMSTQLGEGLRDFREVAMLFAALSGHMTDELVRTAETWRTDLVVYGVFATAGAIAADRLGVPAVQHDIAFTSTAGVHESIVAHLDTQPSHAAVISTAPPSVVAPAEGTWPMRYLPYNGGGVLPDWLLAPAERPRVAVTLGTVSPTMFGLGPVPCLMHIAEEINAEFILALGDTALDGLERLPSNVRSTGWLPLSALLPRCAAVIHHGGSGTVYNALVAGVPQLLVPDGADRALNAAAVCACGAGLSARTKEIDTNLVRRLLNDQALKDATAEIRAEIGGMPTPSTLIHRLTGLVVGT